MANLQLFQSAKQTSLLPAALAVNAEGAPAYALPPRHQLAQYAATGCLNTTFYASGEAQLAMVLELCKAIDPRFIAQTAVYCRERGHMKDMPALLVAVLAGQGAQQLAPAFVRVIDNGKMLRNFVQILRSGAVGRKSLGTRPKKMVQAWLNSASEQALLAASVGNAPSLADVVKMVHPKPQEAWRAAFFAWLVGKPYQAADLPPSLAAFEHYKADPALPLPAVPFQMLTALPLSREQWAQIARQAGWQMLRMNVNTFGRHGVYEIDGMAELIAEKLRDPEAIGKARVFPYQLMSACMAASDSVPAIVRAALEQALELSLLNVPQVAGKVVVCADVSGSMSSPVSGYRGSATSVMRCIDVAALVAAAVLRKNPDTVVLPFEQSVVECALDAENSVMENAAKLAALGGGGTNCSAPLARMNCKKMRADLVIFVSDNESWVDGKRQGATARMHEWQQFKRHNPQARLVCIDIAPYPTTQACERDDILHIGGFSDEVFKMIALFACGQLDPAHWVGQIEAIEFAVV